MKDARKIKKGTGTLVRDILRADPAKVPVPFLTWRLHFRLRLCYKLSGRMAYRGGG
jgi:hypothetical protein